jgi:hypothetical protein
MDLISTYHVQLESVQGLHLLPVQTEECAIARVSSSAVPSDLLDARLFVLFICDPIWDRVYVSH